MHSPPLAFWRQPQNSAVTDYVIEAALLISAYLSAELAPNRPRAVATLRAKTVEATHGRRSYVETSGATAPG